MDSIGSTTLISLIRSAFPRTWAVRGDEVATFRNHGTCNVKGVDLWQPDLRE